MYRDRFRRARAAGYRSGLEVVVAGQLTTLGVPFEYETLKIPFIPSPKSRFYRPDVILPNGIIVETKGRFVTADRQKHLLIQAQHPDLDIRFVFSNSHQRISKQSQTTYALWCETKGFTFADKTVPLLWINAMPNAKALAAIRKLKESQ